MRHAVRSPQKREDYFGKGKATRHFPLVKLISCTGNSLLKRRLEWNLGCVFWFYKIRNPPIPKCLAMPFEIIKQQYPTTPHESTRNSLLSGRLVTYQGSLACTPRHVCVVDYFHSRNSNGMNKVSIRAHFMTWNPCWVWEAVAAVVAAVGALLLRRRPPLSLFERLE